MQSFIHCSFFPDMEDSADNATENSLPVNNESSVGVPDSITTDKSVDEHSEIVNDADNDDTSATASHSGDKTVDETRCKPADVIKYEWTDITSEFFGACSSLELGELVHDSNFGLFEGMSAIEMMDPKMDAGMMCNQTKRKVLSLQQSIEAGTVITEGFSNQDLIGIMDETFACLATWLEGHSLAQTVFINLYLHDPSLVKDRMLRTFCVCFLKLVDSIRDRINRAGVFEEEDFHALTYGFKMAGDETEAAVMSPVKELEEELGRIIKTTRLKSGSERDEATQLEHELCVALNSRLKFTRLFLLTLLTFSKDKCQGIEEGLRYVGQMKELLQQMKQTLHLGTESLSSTGDGDGGERHMMGFEPLINQRLLPPTFPRYTAIRSRGETVEYFVDLVQRLSQFAGIVPLSDNLHALVEFCTEFSRQSPCILSRSLLQLLCVPIGGRHFGSRPALEALKDTLRTFCAAPALMPKNPLYNNPAAKDCIEAFLTHAIRPLTMLIQITGHNRARQRDKWARLLEELAALQDEAERADACIHSLMLKHDASWLYHACFSTWTLYHTLHTMIRHCLAGLELELYLPHEYQYIFWYMCEGLYNWLATTLSRANNFVVEYDMLPKEKAGGKAAKKNKRKKKPGSTVHQAEMTQSQALMSLCADYYKALIGLTMDGKIQQPKYDFDSEEFRYNHRFSQFICLTTPPPLPYAQYKDSTDVSRYEPALSSANLYSASAKSFQQSRLHLENIASPTDEVQTLLKIVKTNFVVVSVLCKGHKRDNKAPMQFDFSLHKLFPVLKLP